MFDDQLLRAAAVRLGGHYDQFSADTIYFMQAKLRHGGQGLTSAVRTSPAAYLGSLAAVATVAEFVPYTAADCPLESDMLLLGWIEQSVQQVVEATPPLGAALPTDASTFFHHVTTTRTYPSTSTSLQHQLSAQAASHSHEAFLSRCWEMRKVDGGAMLAHAKAVSAPRAWAWKNVVPMTQDTDMCGEHYRIAARMKLRLPPIDSMGALPEGKGKGRMSWSRWERRKTALLSQRCGRVLGGCESRCALVMRCSCSDLCFPISGV